MYAIISADSKTIVTGNYDSLVELRAIILNTWVIYQRPIIKFYSSIDSLEPFKVEQW